MSRIPCRALAVAALLASAPPALAAPLSETFEVGGPTPDFATVAEQRSASVKRLVTCSQGP